MGCDIHCILEVKKDDKWINPYDRKLNPYYTKDNNEEEGNEYIPIEVEIDRHYRLFSILAGVRNGYGFAGCDTGDKFKPISLPKGIPDDASEDYLELVNDYGQYGHSHSFLSLKDLEDYDWEQFRKF